MALLQNETYIKISSINIDYVRNLANVTTRRYPTQQQREAEKAYFSELSIFVYRAYQTVIDMNGQVMKAMQEAGFTEEKATEVFSKHPRLKPLIDKYHEIYAEYGYLRTMLGKSEVSRSTLKYLSLWESLGLTEKLCTPLPIYSEVSMSIEIPEKTDLSTVYPAIKAVLPNSVDC